MEQAAAPRLTIAISGARGFVGSRLCELLGSRAHVIGLSRDIPSHASSSVSEWRRCDLFSYEDAYAALEGVDVAFYLVHAMMPSSRLTHASFEDLDVISADHFARAARARGVKQIVYLGGLIPEGEPLSRHLASRREVEQVLAAQGVPVTVLRASMIVGAAGSSFRILFRLVQRLPVMLCPRWMRMRTQPIDLEDVVRLLAYCAGNAETLGKVYDVGGPDVLTYEDMVRRTALALGRRRLLLPFRGFTTGLSCLWVSLVTGAPRSLVRPLVDSLNHETVARSRQLQELAGVPGRPFDESLRDALAAGEQEKPRAFVGTGGKARRSDARSVQRLSPPTGWDAERVGREYLSWLAHFTRIVRVARGNANVITFHLGPIDVPLLCLEYVPAASTTERALYRVIGGLLAHSEPTGRLEFVRIPGTPEVLSALHDFGPRLPWWILRAQPRPGSPLRHVGVRPPPVASSAQADEQLARTSLHVHVHVPVPACLLLLPRERDVAERERGRGREHPSALELFTPLTSPSPRALASDPHPNPLPKGEGGLAPGRRQKEKPPVCHRGLCSPAASGCEREDSNLHGG